MKFTIETKQLYDLVTKAGGIISSNKSLPILSHLKVEVDGNSCMGITGTNLDQFISYQAPLNSPAQAGAVCLPLLPLKKLLNNSDCTTIEIEHENDSCRVQLRFVATKAILPSLPAGEFPRAPRFKTKRASFSEVSVRSDALKAALKRSGPFITTDLSRPGILGTLFEAMKSKSINDLAIVSTDGRRLAHEVIERFPHNRLELRFVVPVEAVNSLLTLLPNEPAEMVTIKQRDGLAVFSCGSLTLTTKLIDDCFPKWAQVAPTEFKEAVMLPLKELRKAACAMQGESLRMTFTKNLLTLSSQDRSGVSVSCDIAINYDADKEQAIGFNTKYLLEIISVFNGDAACCFGMTDELAPAVFRKLNLDGTAHTFYVVIMPTRIS